VDRSQGALLCSGTSGCFLAFKLGALLPREVALPRLTLTSTRVANGMLPTEGCRKAVEKNSSPPQWPHVAAIRKALRFLRELLPTLRRPEESVPIDPRSQRETAKTPRAHPAQRTLLAFA